MLVEPRAVAGFFAGRAALFQDSEFERNEIMLLLITSHHAHQVCSLAMQPIEMRRIYGIFHRLKPVAVINLVFLDPTLAVFPGEHIPARQQRTRLRAKIREQHPAEFLYGIGGVLDLILIGSLLRLGGLLEASSSPVKFPSVIWAANAFFADSAKGERRASMRAVLTDDAIALLPVAVDNKVFSQEANRFDRLLIGELGRHGYRQPVTPQQFSRGSPAADACQRFVFLTSQHRITSSFRPS